MSDDLIKRSDAIEVIWGDDINPSEDGMVFEAQSHIDRDIRLIPSADRPQLDKDIVEPIGNGNVLMSEDTYEELLNRPQGEWIKDNLGTVICSECKRPRRDNRVNHINFCNSCGARMKGAEL